MRRAPDLVVTVCQYEPTESVELHGVTQKLALLRGIEDKLFNVWVVRHQPGQRLRALITLCNTAMGYTTYTASFEGHGESWADSDVDLKLSCEGLCHHVCV